MPYMDRALGAMKAMMLADAMSYPSMMRGRHMTLPWIDRVMDQIEAHGRTHRNTKSVLPFVWHKGEVLKPTATYASEYALFTATMLTELEGRGADYLNAVSSYWQKHIVENEGEIRSAISERAAIINFQKGFQPPVTGNDHPHTYDDGFVCRAIPIALHSFNNSERMSAILTADGAVTHADEGLFAGCSMAAAIAAGMRGESLEEMLQAALAELPAVSWVGDHCKRALEIADHSENPFALIPQLETMIVSRIYNYGNLAAETLAVAYAVFKACGGKMEQAIPLSLCFPRLADSVPAFVGALCGVYEGLQKIPDSYKAYIQSVQGVCIPAMKDVDVDVLIHQLVNGKDGQHE